MEMEQRLSAFDAAFDYLPETNDAESDRLSPAGYIQDMRFEPSTQVEETDWEDQNREALLERIE